MGIPSTLILALLIGLNGRWYAAQSTPVDMDRVTLSFADDVSIEDETTIRQGAQFAMDYLTDVMGPFRSGFKINSVYVPDGYLLNYGQTFEISINTWDMRGYSNLYLLRGMVHESFHTWQGQNAGMSVGGGDRMGPQWIVEGSAEFVAYGAIVEAGFIQKDEMHELFVTRAISGDALPELSTMYTYKDMTFNCCPYDLAALAMEMLAETAGIQAIGNYFENLRGTSDWQQAFEDAFGLSVESFYFMFENARPELLVPAGIDVNWLGTTPPFNHDTSSIELELVHTAFAASTQQLLTGSTTPGTHCEVVLNGTEDTIEMPTYADRYGNIFWLWSRELNVESATVHCGSGDAVDVGLDT